MSGTQYNDLSGNNPGGGVDLNNSEARSQVVTTETALGTVTSETITVGTSVVVLAAADENRTLLRGQNLGPGIVYINEDGTDPVAGNDYSLAVGDSFDVDSNEEVRVLSTIAATKVRISRR